MNRDRLGYATHRHCCVTVPAAHFSFFLALFHVKQLWRRGGGATGISRNSLGALENGVRSISRAAATACERAESLRIVLGA
jgi:hypothetical protein